MRPATSTTARTPAFWRVVGKGSRTVGTFVAPEHLEDWKRRIRRSVEVGAACPERFTVIELDALGCELSRRIWSPA